MTDGWDGLAEVPARPTDVLAGRGARLGAWAIGVAIWWVVPLIVAAVAVPHAFDGWASGRYDEAGDPIDQYPDAHTAVVLILMAWATVMTVTTIVLMARNGQNIGKYVLHLRMVRTTGERAGFWRLFGLRSLASGAIGAFVPFYAIINVCFIFRSDRRCVHDLIADTIVIRDVPVAIVEPDAVAPAGTTATVTCPSCGSPNPVTARFCQGCGFARTLPPPPPAAPAPIAPPPDDPWGPRTTE